MSSETWRFKISLPKREHFVSQKFTNYGLFTRECEKKCRELHACEDAVTIILTDEHGDTYSRKPEHGELSI